MSKALKAVATVAGVVASVAAFVPGGQAVAAIAGAVSGLAGAASQALAKPPRARGSTSQILIGSDMPMPYAMGRTYVGGNLVWDVGWGGKVDKVQNPYRALTTVYSLGPIDSFESFQADFAAVSFSGAAATGYYAGHLYRVSQLGAQPEGAALTAQWGSEPGWSSAHKLSGKAAVKWSAKFDKDGKIFASGIPQLGAVLKGVKVYDPRADSTYPGGSGSQRIANEATWAWSANPALHALAYAYGRFQNGKKVFGVELGTASIDLASVVAWANVCDANGWVIGGTIFEPGDKWNNLKLIAQAGGARPAFNGGVLTFIYDAPVVQLDTITVDDLADGEVLVPGIRDWREAVNTVIPKYRSEGHLWEIVAAGAVVYATGVTADGEVKRREEQFDLVQGAKQAADLAGYSLFNGRELGPFSIPVKPRLAEYGVGDGLTLDLPEAGLDEMPCRVIGRTPMPATGCFLLELMSETEAKHAFALGQSAAAPPLPTLTPPEDVDEAVATAGQDGLLIQLVWKRAASLPATPTGDGIPSGWSDDPPSGSDPLWMSEAKQELDGALVTGESWSTPIRHDGPAGADGAPGTLSVSALIRSAYPKTGGGPLFAVTASSITINNHEWDYPDPQPNCSRTGATISSGLSNNTLYYIYFDDATLTDTAPAYGATTVLATALNSAAHPDRHLVGNATTNAGGGSGGGGSGGGGYGGVAPGNPIP